MGRSTPEYCHDAAGDPGCDCERRSNQVTLVIASRAAMTTCYGKTP
ncbi:MAG: hypothetical protein WCK53_05240 [Methanomicrobiales archaeon]